ncbi:hypothetical protein LWI29_014931 [Acer saccharum]|uniref:Protein LAZY 1-like n=1 Tax=Acer saccharum TaxID=4024 RepID=A0AA39RHE9_ACESA|nr:hypothetical protein LWI29_014931 [Acer saccharum]KAK1553369.1 hypothetical protein Q3G72_033783 [Acer saccharum]
MKLLGWMHRKFRQNSSEPFKDFAIGNACTCLTGGGQTSVDDQQCYQKPSYGYKQFKQGQREHQMRNSFAGLEAARVVEEDDYEDDHQSSAAISELFHGFLAIGTLGSSDPNNNNVPDPSTPTFGISSLENITEKETEVTENELKLINDELEKVLGAEANREDGCCNDSSGRNSYVSLGRSSHGSSITLSGKPLMESHQDTVCPLQEYLFGSAIELSETTTTVANNNKTIKEHRTSLGELFQRTKLVSEENYSTNQEKRTDKEADKSAVHIMKKLLKKKMLHASRSSGGSTVDSASSAETKLHKILHMFHRKVHPESSAATKKNEKILKKENSVKKTMIYSYEDDGGHQMVPEDQDIMIFPQRSLSKEKMRRYKSQSNLSQFSFAGSDSNGNREYWIKTDADCKYAFFLFPTCRPHYWDDIFSPISSPR